PAVDALCGGLSAWQCIVLRVRSHLIPSVKVLEPGLEIRRLEVVRPSSKYAAASLCENSRASVTLRRSMWMSACAQRVDLRVLAAKSHRAPPARPRLGLIIEDEAARRTLALLEPPRVAFE